MNPAESPERAQPSLVGGGYSPQPLSAPLPSREAGGGPELGSAHDRAPLRNGNWGRPQGELPAPAESPETAQPSLVGGGIPPNLCPLRFPLGKRAEVRNWDRRTTVRPYGTGTGAARRASCLLRRRVQRRRSPLWWGGYSPQPLSAPLPSREAGGGPELGSAHDRAPLRNGNWGRPQGELPAPAESPERAQPSLVGTWGYPPTTFRPASQQGSGRMSGAGTGAQPCAPTERELGPPAGRAACSGGESRDGAALFGGGLGVPPNYFPLCFPLGKRAESGAATGAQPCAPTNSGTRAGGNSSAACPTERT